MSRPATTERAAKRAFAKAFRRAAHESDVTQSELAELIGISPQRVCKMMDPEEQQQLPASYIPMMGETGLRLLVHLSAEHPHPHHLVAAEEDEHGDDHISRLHSLLKECSDVTITYSEAIRDGHINRAERGRMLTEIREARETLRKAERALDAAQREGTH